MHNHTRRRTPIHSEHGQTMAEYSILIAVIALIVIAVLPEIASGVDAFYNAAAAVFGG